MAEDSLLAGIRVREQRHRRNQHRMWSCPTVSIPEYQWKGIESVRPERRTDFMGIVNGNTFPDLQGDFLDDSSCIP